MGNLALTYSDLGRHDDALAMGERALELPEDDSDLSEGDVWCLIACF